MSSSDWVDNFYKYSDKVFKENNITHFVDGGGYSLIGEYKDSFKRRMGVGSDGNQVPFFKFYFDKDYKFDGDKYVPLTVSVGLTTRVEDGSEIRYMLNDSRIKHLRPIDLFSRDEFYIGQNDGRVYERKDKKFTIVDLNNLYTRMYNVHVSDVLSLSGVYRRTKILLLRKIPSFLFASCAWILGWPAYFIKRDRYTYNVISERFLNRRNDGENITSPTTHESDINFFGYKVSLWTLYTYSFLAILAYLIWKSSLVALMPKDSTGSVFVIAFAIFTIVTYDRMIPYFLKVSIRFSSIQSYDLKYKGIKLKI